MFELNWINMNNWGNIYQHTNACENGASMTLYITPVPTAICAYLIAEVFD